jgi:glycosyltransferase involved in cell wall biosynthesis
MNLLFLSELFYPHGGGAEFATYLFAKSLAEIGFKVIVVTNKFPGETDVCRDENLTICRIPLFDNKTNLKYSVLKRLDVLFSGFLSKTVQWSDVVYIPRYWYSAALFAKAHHKPVIIHLHDYITVCPLALLQSGPGCQLHWFSNFFCSPKCIYSYERRTTRSLFSSLSSTLLNSSVGHYMNWFAQFGDVIICASKAQKDIILKKSFYSPLKVHIVYNLVPEISYVPLEGDDLAYFGGSSPLKGFEVLKRALCFVGVKSLRLKAAGFSIAKNVQQKLRSGIILENYGWLRRDQMTAFYRSAKAVVIPSISPEPLPYVTYEALLRGRLVVGSQIGGIPEQTRNYEGCFLFHPGDFKELSDIIDRVVKIERKEAIEIGIRNRESFLSRDHNGANLHKLVEIIQGLA